MLYPFNLGLVSGKPGDDTEAAYSTWGAQVIYMPFRGPLCWILGRFM